MPSISSTLVPYPTAPVTSRPPSPVSPAPIVNQAPVLNSFLRCPLPSLVSASPDNLRQYYVGGTIPQYRFPTLPLLSSGSGSAGASTPSGTISGSFTTSSNASDVVSLVGVTGNSQVTLTPTNSTAAAMTGVYVAKKSTNTITVMHPAVAGGTFSIIASI